MGSKLALYAIPHIQVATLVVAVWRHKCYFSQSLSKGTLYNIYGQSSLCTQSFTFRLLRWWSRSGATSVIFHNLCRKGRSIISTVKARFVRNPSHSGCYAGGRGLAPQVLFFRNLCRKGRSIIFTVKARF